MEKVPIIRWKQGNIPVLYEAVGVDLSVADMLPSYLACKPSVGDLVESLNGRRLVIKGVVHTTERNSAVLRLIVGKDSGGHHAESGGGSETDW